MNDALRIAENGVSAFSPSSVLLSDTTVEVDAKRPQWASQLWNAGAAVEDGQQQQYGAPPMAFSSPLASSEEGEDVFATQRQHSRQRSGLGMGMGMGMPMRRTTLTPVTQLFQSSSAPSGSHVLGPMSSPTGMTMRSYSRRSESISESDDRDATIRKKRRAQLTEADEEEQQLQHRRERQDSRASEGKAGSSSRDSREWNFFFFFFVILLLLLTNEFLTHSLALLAFHHSCHCHVTHRSMHYGYRC